MTGSILIVDDTQQTKKLLEKIVSHLCPNHEVVTADHGKAALEYLATHTPLLVFTDLEMPQINGYDLIAAMQANPEHAEIPVVVISAHADYSNDSRVVRELEDRNLPPCPVMGKPLNIEHLKTILHQHLGVAV